MQWQGSRDIPIAELIYNRQDIAERQQTARVAELAASMRRLGGEPIQPLTVQDVTNLLIAGRDRLAACLMLKLETVPCRVADEFTARELLEVEVEENVRRRTDDRDLLLSRLVEETAKEKASKAPGLSKPPAKGRPVTAKGSARAEVAKLAGTTPEAVRRAETRAAAKTEPPKPVVVAPFLADFGVGWIAQLDAEATRVAQHLSTAAKALARAQAAFTEATEALGQLYGDAGHYTAVKPFLADASRLREQTHRLAGQVRGQVPTTLCPYGKGTCTKDCPACRGLQWATADQEAAQVPAELLREGADAMVSNGAGGFEPFAKVPGSRPPSVGGKRPGEKKGAATAAHEPGGGTPAVAVPAPPPPTSHTEGMGPADVAPINLAGLKEVAAGHRPDPGLSLDRAARGVLTANPPRRMQVTLDDGRVVDPSNPPDDLKYSGDDAPVQDVPDLVVEPDEAIEWSDDDGQGAA